ncbi:hypothetical protein JMUB7471_27250 [Staphylococcus aureus]
MLHVLWFNVTVLAVLMTGGKLRLKRDFCGVKLDDMIAHYHPTVYYDDSDNVL